MCGGSGPGPSASVNPHSISPTPRSAPVVPATAASMWVPGQVGSKQEAGVGRLAPGTLAGVGQAVLARQTPRTGAEAMSLQPMCPRIPTHSLGPAGLTGCRAGDTPLGSSGHPDPGPADCMLHPPCGWCSDATHRRGPGGGWTESALGSALSLEHPVSIHHCSKAAPPCPAVPLRLPFSYTLFCLTSTHPSLGNSTFLWGHSGADSSLGSRGGQGVMLPPNPRDFIRSLQNPTRAMKCDSRTSTEVPELPVEQSEVVTERGRHFPLDAELEG